ncbi:MAG: aminoacyl-tRNA hydrolase [Candidatus Taylorbacteria bacterium]|nr:aminoacyl-tRNA hydrolase [Candidatus Taylorbacteria bacterium]
MSYIIVGLGNPGNEYEGTRHNTGRIVLDAIRKEYDGSEFKVNKNLNALTAEIKIGKEKVSLVAPETYMNDSGKAVGQLIKTVKAAQKLTIIYDDFNLPLGRIKISYDRSSGGHNGLESVIKSVKTTAFTRIRVGTASANSKGEAKVPHGDVAIERFILGKFKDEEIKTMKKVAKTAAEAVACFIKEGREKAMSVFNAS